MSSKLPIGSLPNMATVVREALPVLPEVPDTRACVHCPAAHSSTLGLTEPVDELVRSTNGFCSLRIAKLNERE